MSVGEICSREVVFARKGDSLRVAAGLMREHHVGALVIVDEAGGRRVPIGMLTDRDIVIAAIAKGLDPDGLLVEEVMSGNVVTAKDSDGVSECIARMRANAIRRMPIVDITGRLVGIVTADDFLDLLAEELTALARTVSNEQRREVRVRQG